MSNWVSTAAEGTTYAPSKLYTSGYGDAYTFDQLKVGEAAILPAWVAQRALPCEREQRWLEVGVRFGGAARSWLRSAAAAAEGGAEAVDPGARGREGGRGLKDEV